MSKKYVVSCRVTARRCVPDNPPEAAMKHLPSPADATAEAPAATGAAPPATRHRISPAVGAQAQAATVGAVGALARSLSVLVVEEEDIPDAAVGDPAVGLQDQRSSLEVEVVEVLLDAAVEDPVVGLQDQRASLEVEAVEDHLDPAVGDPQATAWEEDTAAVVGDQARRSLLAQVVEEVARLDAAVEDLVVGPQDQRSSLQVEVVEVPLDTAVEDPAMAWEEDPVVDLQDQRASLEVEVVGDHLDAAVEDPAMVWEEDPVVGLQDQRASLEVEVVGDPLDAEVEDLPMA